MLNIKICIFDTKDERSILEFSLDFVNALTRYEYFCAVSRANVVIFGRSPNVFTFICPCRSPPNNRFVIVLNFKLSSFPFSPPRNFLPSFFSFRREPSFALKLIISAKRNSTIGRYSRRGRKIKS